MPKWRRPWCSPADGRGQAPPLQMAAVRLPISSLMMGLSPEGIGQGEVTERLTVPLSKTVWGCARLCFSASDNLILYLEFPLFSPFCAP